MLKTRAQIEVTAENRIGHLLVDTDTPIPVVKDIITKLLVFVQGIEDNMKEQAAQAEAQKAADQQPASPEPEEPVAQ